MLDKLPNGANGEPDAEIIALVEAIMAHDEETTRLALAEEASDQPERARIQAAIERLVSDEWDMRARLAGLHATTMAGLRAKARVVHEFNTCHDSLAGAYDFDAVAWSLANDLLGLPTVFLRSRSHRFASEDR